MRLPGMSGMRGRLAATKTPSPWDVLRKSRKRATGLLRPDLDAILATIGIHDFRHIRPEGLGRGAEAVERACRHAHETLATLELPH